MPVKTPMWTGQIRKRQRMVAPERDPKPFEVPNPEEGRPYIPANYDFSPGRLVPEGYGQYVPPLEQEQSKSEKGVYSKGSRPSAQAPAQDWRGYKQDNWVRSQRDEHLLNGREGLPIRQSHHQPALNPYQYRIPDERTPRAPHEFAFIRPFDQMVLGERNLNGMHYSEATIGLTKNPSDSLKGMTAPFHRTSTFRLEPTQWGENTVSIANRAGPQSAVYTSAYSGAFNGYSASYRLG